MSWRVINVRPAKPSPEWGAIRAVALEVEQGPERRCVAVELAGTAPIIRGDLLELRDTFEELLDDDEPPRRVIVSTGGAVRAVD